MGMSRCESCRHLFDAPRVPSAISKIKSEGRSNATSGRRDLHDGLDQLLLFIKSDESLVELSSRLNYA